MDNKKNDLSGNFFVEKFSIDTSVAKTDEHCVFVKDDVRFSLISERILRVEMGTFTDMPTQKVISRSFSSPKMKVSEKGSMVYISSEKCVFTFDVKKKEMEAVTLNGGKRVTDFYSGNLRGSARTLDMVNGSTKLDFGLISKDGVSVLDDSKSCVLKADGTIAERDKCKDLYFFAFGHDYRGCIKAFTLLCGNIPLIPRFALGNWWSRYKAYTQDEYLDLMKKFREKKIPISVATIDMDWHWTDVVERFGKENVVEDQKRKIRNISELFQSSGWTGYSWNTELFPDHKALLEELHDQGKKIPVNLHPAQGIRPFEDCYEEMAEFMGIDPKTKKHVRFDIADPKFVEGYFKIVHKPLEDEGVDFWWIDWQQEKTTKIKGLDPLWALNHYHTLAFNGENKRPLILSRYAGVGSHRYPLGFSGDTIISWKSLDFQPYFTANAANVAYTWWSHDIGGHQLGAHNDELYARWVQLGEFSPIMRLHSTSDEFMGKEPWNYSFAAEEAATNALRERHALIPYIYSMNKRTHDESIALCEPVYYAYPDDESAYLIKNEFFFGSELLVVPVTSPADEKTKMAGTLVWLPEGRWTDFYNGYIYIGGRFVRMFRDLRSLPVLAKEGAIVPMSEENENDDPVNPENLKVRIWRGTGSFTLYEDDGKTMDFEKGAFAETKFSISEKGKEIEFTVSPAEGDISVIPEKRNITLIFEDVASFGSAKILIGGKEHNVIQKSEFGKTEVTFEGVSPKDRIEIRFSNITARKNPEKKALITERLSKVQMTMVEKRVKFGKYIKNPTEPLHSGDKEIDGAVNEIFSLE